MAMTVNVEAPVDAMAVDVDADVPTDEKTVEVNAASCSFSADHANYTQKDSPIHVKRKMVSVQRSLHSCKKKLRLYTQGVRRLKWKVKSLSSAMSDL